MPQRRNVPQTAQRSESRNEHKYESAYHNIPMFKHGYKSDDSLSQDWSNPSDSPSDSAPHSQSDTSSDTGESIWPTIAKANGPKSLSASAALSFRAAQKHLVAKIELKCVVFRQQAGNLFIEHLSVTRKRMDLWRIATESLKHHKQLSANIDQGDIVGLWHSVLMSGQPNPRDLISNYMSELLEHRKDENVGFAHWLLEQQTIIEHLEQ